MSVQLEALYREFKQVRAAQEVAARRESELRSRVELMDSKGYKDDLAYSRLIGKWYRASQDLWALNRAIGRNNALRGRLLREIHSVPRRVA